MNSVPRQTFISVSRNNFVSTAGTASDTSTYAVKLERFVYFDPRYEKMMEYNPYLGTDPVEFVF